MSSSWEVEGMVGSVVRRWRGSELPFVNDLPVNKHTLVDTAIVRYGERNESLGIATLEILIVVEILVQFLRLDRIRNLRRIDADTGTGQRRTSCMGWGRDVVLRGVVVLVRLRCRRRRRLRLLELSSRSVRTCRSGTVPVVGNIVQLRTLRIHVRLLVLGLLAVLLRRGLTKARGKRGVLLVVRRLRLAPLLGRVGLSREGGIDGVARPGGHAWRRRVRCRC